MQAARRSLCSYARLRHHVKRSISGQLSQSLKCASCVSIQRKLYSTEAIPTPHIEGAEKIYPDKIQNIVSEISGLTLLEVADLNDLLKKTLKIADAPVMAMGAAPAAAKEEDEEEAAPKVVQTLFTVKLNKFDAGKKVALIKEIKATIAGMNLVQAKKFVESCPQPVLADLSKEDAEKLKEKLTSVGGECVVE